MILTEKINIKISPRNYNHFKKLGYVLKVNDFITIKTEELSENSKLKIKVKCDNCNNEKEISYCDYITVFNKKNKYFCNKCRSCSIKEGTKIKYGVDNVFQLESVKKQIKETNNINLGVDYPMQNKDVREKSTETSIKNWNTKHPMQHEINKKKQEETNLIIYQSKSSAQNPDVKLKMIKTNNERYDTDYVTQNKDIINKIQKAKLDRIIEKFSEYNVISIDYDKKLYTLKCDCGLDHTFEISPDLFRNRKKINTILCTKCNDIQIKDSGYEKQLFNFIKENYPDDIVTNKRELIHPHELDIFLPEINLAFEFNGVYWHNELYKDKNYHLNKLNKCIEKDIKLIQIFEDDWLYKQEIIKSRILNLIKKNTNKIYARKCVIKEITDESIIRIFLTNNHIQGYISSFKKIGLYYNNELVSIMSFGKLRKPLGNTSEKNIYELLRFCNKLNTSVIGGASRLFQYFIKNYNPIEIITYADRCWSSGNLYNELGFNFITNTPPNYYYVIDGIRKHRFGFRKDILVKEGYDSNKSEHEIMLERKIYRIYDAGHLKFNYLV